VIVKKIVHLWDEIRGQSGLLRFLVPGLESILCRDPFYSQEMFRLRIAKAILDRHAIKQEQITELQNNIERTAEASFYGPLWKTRTSLEFGYDLFSAKRCPIMFLYKELIGICIMAGLKTYMMESGEAFSGNAFEAVFKRIDVQENDLIEFFRKEKLPLPSTLFPKKADSTENVLPKLNDLISSDSPWVTDLGWKEFASITEKVIKNLQKGISISKKAIFSDPGLKWDDIKINVVEKDTLEFRNLLTKERKRKTYIELGLVDSRKGKAAEPIKLWDLLCILAAFRGQHAKGDKIFENKIPNSKQSISNLRKLFHEWFPTIEGDPFKPSRRAGGYRPLLSIEDKTNG
jgi:hypothetical protein